MDLPKIVVDFFNSFYTMEQKEAFMEKDLRNAKLMGGIGAILPLIGLLFARRVYGFSTLLSVASIVLILLALKEISQKTMQEEIFSLYLTGFIIQVIGYVVLMFFALFGGLAAILSMGFSGFGAIRSLGVGLMLILLAFYVLNIISSYYIKKSFEKVSEATNNPNFRTAGLLLFLGAIFLILFGIGIIIYFVGIIFEIIGFFSLPDVLKEA